MDRRWLPPGRGWVMARGHCPAMGVAVMDRTCDYVLDSWGTECGEPAEYLVTQELPEYLSGRYRRWHRCPEHAMDGMSGWTTEPLDSEGT